LYTVTRTSSSSTARSTADSTTSTTTPTSDTTSTSTSTPTSTSTTSTPTSTLPTTNTTTSVSTSTTTPTTKTTPTSTTTTTSTSKSPIPLGHQSISTDQPDYLPGATVTLSGSGWQPAEKIHISVNDALGTSWSYSTAVVADVNGAFTPQFAISSLFVSSYTAVATGTVSGSATTTFSDSAANLDQCTNGGVGDTP